PRPTFCHSATTAERQVRAAYLLQFPLELNSEEKSIYKIDYSGFCGLRKEGRISLILLVGAGRFERPTPCAQGRCATRLRYAPTLYEFDSKLPFPRMQPGRPALAGSRNRKRLLTCPIPQATVSSPGAYNLLCGSSSEVK